MPDVTQESKLPYRDHHCKAVKDLCLILDKIEKDNSIITIDNSAENTLVKEAIDLVYGLINEESTRVSSSIRREMQENGYLVYAGEQDSFGWLVGCIKTKNGIIVFG